MVEGRDVFKGIYLVDGDMWERTPGRKIILYYSLVNNCTVVAYCLNLHKQTVANYLSSQGISTRRFKRCKKYAILRT